MRSGLAAAAAGLVLTAFLAPAARAADAPASPHFNIMGPSGCANWPKSGAITSASKAVSLNWALGYLSGSAAQDNLALLDQFDPDSVDAWLTTYCGAHPADPLPLAVRELERDLKEAAEQVYR